MVVTKRHGFQEDGPSTHHESSIDDRDMQRMALPAELRVSIQEVLNPSRVAKDRTASFQACLGDRLCVHFRGNLGVGTCVSCLLSSKQPHLC